MNLKDLLQQAIREATEQETVPAKVEVAKIDEELGQLLETLQKEQQSLSDLIELKETELRLQYQRELDAAMEPYHNQYVVIHKQAWDAIYEQCGLNQEAAYTVDIKGRTVYRVEDAMPEADTPMLQ